VVVHRAYTFRLHPTVGQRARLVALLAAMGEIYNAGEERRGAWRWEQRLSASHSRPLARAHPLPRTARRAAHLSHDPDMLTLP
jgi:hypothetical protein